MFAWNVETQSKGCYALGKIVKFKLLVVNELKPEVWRYSISLLSIPPYRVYTLPAYGKHEKNILFLSLFHYNEICIPMLVLH